MAKPLADEAIDQDPHLPPRGFRAFLSRRAAETLTYAAGVIRRHPQKIGSCWRKLNHGRPCWWWPTCRKGDRADPEQEAELADAAGMALLVVLDTLSRARRFAFVLHDMFAVPFDDIAPIVGRSPNAAAQLASRARRRVRGSAAANREWVDPRRPDPARSSSSDGLAVSGLPPLVCLRDQPT